MYRTSTYILGSPDCSILFMQQNYRISTYHCSVVFCVYQYLYHYNTPVLNLDSPPHLFFSPLGY
uniref:Uncharacterized protein n=1 Tax=Triticum urartu TaxID=4572 RepID=A0A8R7NWN2_TRIUA